MADIADFIQMQTGLDEVNHRSFGLMLIDQCRKRSKRLADISDFDSLMSSKFVTRSDMDQWLSILREKHSSQADWSSVAPHIADFKIARELRLNWENYGIERRRRYGATLLKFQAEVL